MPTPERGRGRIPPDRTPPPEPEPSLWYRAARFPSEPPSERAYFHAQETIYSNECDLSAYRLMLEQIWHVAVLGGAPAEAALQQHLEGILYAEGTPTPLPDTVLTYLADRREQQSKKGSWVEGHYRPGKVVDIQKKGNKRKR